MNLQAIHYVMLICGALAAGLPNLEAAFPPGATPILKAMAAVFVLLTAVLGAVSPSAGGPKSGDGDSGKKDAVSAAADKLTPPAAHRGMLKAGLLGLASAVLVVCAVMLSGCNQPVLPVFEQVVAVVEQDIQNNVSDSQMASDVCKAMGGTATTDAVCAGVEVVIQDAVQLLIDSGVLSGNSLARAKSYMGDHPKTTVTVTAPAGGK